MNKIINLLFVALLFVTAQTVKIQSQSSIMAETNTETSLANRIYVTVDNVLDALIVGPTNVNLTGVWGTTNWTQVSTINVPIFEGYTITIAGHNISGPKGLLACFHYRDSFGIDHEICTGKGWYCNGQLAKDYGKNGVSPWGSRPFINTNARWIWSQDNAQYVKCYYTIKPKPNIFLTVDNELTNLSIGNVSLSLAPAIYYNDWTKVDQLFHLIKEGDIISITGKNYGSYSSGNPGALIGSFHYLNKWGVHKVINTNAKWYCNKRGAYSWGLNGVSPWGFKAPIEPQAEWIWSQNLKDPYATCYTKVPVTKFPPNIFISATAALAELKVNGQVVGTEEAATSIDGKTKALSYTIQEGDIVEIASNVDNESINQNALAASIHYVDSEGKVNVLSSCSNWTCNGKKAQALGVNGDEKFGTVRELQPDAKFITFDNTDGSDVAQVRCKIQIPIIKPNIPPNVFFSADNSFTSFRVNGDDIDLNDADYLNDATKADSLALNIQPGDFIELTGEIDITTSKVGGIIASIHYIDVNGKPAILNTNRNWTCNQVAALDVGLNGEAPLPAIESIEPNASWIWFDSNPIIVVDPLPEISVDEVDTSRKENIIDANVKVEKPVDAAPPAATGFIQVKQDTAEQKEATEITPTEEPVDTPILISPKPEPPISTTFTVTCSITVPKRGDYPEIDPKDC